MSKGNHSTIIYARLDGPLYVAERWDTPFMLPEFDYETKGVENTRIVKIDDVNNVVFSAGTALCRLLSKACIYMNRPMHRITTI